MLDFGSLQSTNSPISYTAYAQGRWLHSTALAGGRKNR